MLNKAIYDNSTEKALIRQRATTKEKREDVFAEGDGFIIGMEGKKEGKPHSLITVEHFEEMLRFDNWFYHEL